MNRRANSSVSPSTSRRSFAQIASALQRVLLNNKICLKINERVGDLIYHIASTETSRKNFLLLFTVKLTLDLAVNKICLYLIKFWIRFKTRNEEATDLETIPEANNAPIVVDIIAYVISPFSRGLHFCRMRRTSYIMDRFCLLYLLLILLMRSGDVETNPGPNTAVSNFGEMEFLKLAQDIAPSYYNDVGITLGFSYVKLQAILVENMRNYTNALLEVFMKWNVKQQLPHSNKRQLLADKLREIDLGGLSDGLLNGPPIPNSTDSKSCLRNPASTPRRISSGPTQYHIEKRVYCTPYVRPPVGKKLRHFVMVYIYGDDPAVIEKTKDEMKEYTRLHPPQQMCVDWTCGPIIIKLFEGPKGKKKEIDEKSLGKKDLYFLDKIISFEVEPLESGAGQKLLKLTLSQKESSCETTELEFDLPYDDTTRTTAAAAETFPPVHAGSQTAETFPPVHAGSQAAEVSMLLQIDLESDGILDTLSKHILPRYYAPLCRHLGIVYNEGHATLNKFGMDYQRATRHCLADWKTTNGYSKDQLRNILWKANVGCLGQLIP